jgi:hypothetical protein
MFGKYIKIYLSSNNIKNKNKNTNLPHNEENSVIDSTLSRVKNRPKQGHQ